MPAPRPTSFRKAPCSKAIRTNKAEEREKLIRRLKEVAEGTAAVYGGTAEVKFPCGVPTLVCDAALTNEMVGYMKELPIPGLMGVPNISASASEDFALITEQIPSAYLYLSAGYLDERGEIPAHNPKVQFNEDVCPIGVAYLTHCAERWLETHA